MREREVYEALHRAVQEGRPAVLATLVKVHGSAPGALGQKMLIPASGEPVGTVGGGCVDGEVLEAAPDVLRAGVPRTVTVDLTGREDDSPLICGGKCEVFLEPLQTLRMVICGAGHVGQALARLARPLGWSCTVLDDRGEFASPERFPGCELRVAPFEELKETPLPGEWVVVVTRAHQYDTRCAAWALRQRPRYLGVIGSRRKTETVRRNLVEMGFSTEEIASVRMPIGLDIGAETVEEIALSILAEMVVIRRLGRDVSRQLWRDTGGLETT